MSNTTISTKKKRRGGTLWETFKTILYAIIAAMVVRTVAYEPFNIPSGSMIPTLLVGDYLFVSKFSYGYTHYSLPWSPRLFSGRILHSVPERGDVAVFKLPTDNETDYIKRIIGLPGDRIQMLNSMLYINGEPVPREQIEDYVYTDAQGSEQRIPRFIETLPNGKSFTTLDRASDGLLDNTPVFVVPEGHYFAMGDNRDSSLDSRTRQVGYIPEENLIGRADSIFFSSNGTAHFWEVWKWGSAIRGSRLFTEIK
ncbi:MAG: signal peptidase I [Alphaproteobacteria bacterium]|nr:signal peptidase I [Alphaproteobacteria bacterium]